MSRNPLSGHRARLYQDGQDLTDPAARQSARAYTLYYDHGILRIFWSNFFEIAPGVFRSNQPDLKRLQYYAKMGITSILNLRGASMSPPYLLECEFCAATGQDLIDINHLSARKAPSRAALLALVDTMRCTPKPFLFHCKSGADRTSLAAAIYLMVFEGAPVSTARRQFSVRFLHLKWTKSGVLDHILDVFENEAEPRGIDFETWLRTEYDGSKIQRSFHEGRA